MKAGLILMTLQNARIGGTYIINSMDLEAAALQRLGAMGMTRGTGVRLLNRNREGTVILMVRGSRLALGRGLTGSILIREA